MTNQCFRRACLKLQDQRLIDFCDVRISRHFKNQKHFAHASFTLANETTLLFPWLENGLKHASKVNTLLKGQDYKPSSFQMNVMNTHYLY